MWISWSTFRLVLKLLILIQLVKRSSSSPASLRQLVRGKLQVSSGQVFHLVTPASAGFHLERHRLLKLRASYDDTVNLWPDSEDSTPENTSSPSYKAALTGFTATTAEQRNSRERTAAAALLSRHACVGFARRGPHHSFAASCADAFTRYWEMNRSASVVCGGRWMPRGGRPGDTSNDPLLPYHQFADALVFTLPLELLNTLAAQPQSPNYDHTNDLRVCFYPFLGQVKDVAPIDIGALSFIDAPLLTPAIPLNKKTAVRIFLEPGWELHFALRGIHLNQNVNVVSLKLQDCSGFYDSLSYYYGYAQEVYVPESETLFYNEVVQEAQFSFSMDFKSEESDLSRWHLRYLDLQRRQAFSRSIPPFRLRQNGSFAENVRDEKSPARSSSDIITAFEICFFASTQEWNGTSVGAVSFYSDHRDSAQLVGFIIFTVMLVPFLCGLTFSCYSYRHRKLRQKLRRMRLVQQREEVGVHSTTCVLCVNRQIEQRLLESLGFDEKGSEEDEDDTVQIHSESQQQQQQHPTLTT